MGRRRPGDPTPGTGRVPPRCGRSHPVWDEPTGHRARPYAGCSVPRVSGGYGPDPVQLSKVPERRADRTGDPGPGWKNSCPWATYRRRQWTSTLTRHRAFTGRFPSGPTDPLTAASGSDLAARRGVPRAGDLDMPEADWVAREICHRIDVVVVSGDHRLAAAGGFRTTPRRSVLVRDLRVGHRVVHLSAVTFAGGGEVDEYLVLRVQPDCFPDEVGEVDPVADSAQSQVDTLVFVSGRENPIGDAGVDELVHAAVFQDACRVGGADCLVVSLLHHDVIDTRFG